jgi:predicted Zn-dependent protease with MMP-like domain
MFSTASKHRWLALYEGVKIGDRVVGYAAEECNRITALYSTESVNCEI